MIIADTSAILASIDSDADEYAACVEIFQHLQRPMIVSHMVVAETDHLLTTRFGISTANLFLSDVARGAYELAASSADDIHQVVTINTQYADLMLGATDCLNIVLAEHYSTTTLFTLDYRHYRAVTPRNGAAAFQLVPADQ